MPGPKDPAYVAKGAKDPAYVVVLLLCLLLSACAKPKPAVTPAAKPSGPTAAERVFAADALVRAGCFDCLTDAFKEYDAARSAADPATRDTATLGAVRTAILLDVRARELGFTNERMLDTARTLLAGVPGADPMFATAIDVVSTIRWPLVGTMESDAEMLAASRRAAQNREAWKTALHQKAGEHPFWAYMWAAFACQTGETRLMTPEELAAPYAALGDVPLVAYKTAQCPATKGRPDKVSAVDVPGLIALQKAEPRFKEIDYHLGVFNMMAAKLEEANDLLERAYIWHQRWPNVTTSLAAIAMSAEDFERALGFYEATLELVPGLPDGMLGRAKTLSFMGRNEDAIKAVDEILAGRWNRGEALYWRAWNNMQLTRNDQAWEDVEAAGRLWVNSDVAKLAGMIAYRRKEIDVAREKFEQGHRMNADDCELGFYLGLVNAEQARWPPTAEVLVVTVPCMQVDQKRRRDEIAIIEASTAGPERKARQVARREKIIQDEDRMIAQSWYNIAVAYFNLRHDADARAYAEKVAQDEQFGQRAREILARLK